MTEAWGPFNGVYVTYKDAGGAVKTVGPPGSIADDIDERLAREDPSLQAHGIDRRWVKLRLEHPTNLKAAVRIGEAWAATRRWRLGQ